MLDSDVLNLSLLQVTLKAKKCFSSAVSYVAVSYGDEKKSVVCNDNK